MSDRGEEVNHEIAKLKSELEDHQMQGEFATVGELYPQDQLQISIRKMDNGFVVNLNEPPKRQTEEELEKELEADRPKNPEAQVDALVDGIVAFTKYINDKGAGEDWKDHSEEVKVQMRKGFKIFFPNLNPDRSRRPRRPISSYQPRVEQNVFQTKEELLAYIQKNL